MAGLTAAQSNGYLGEHGLFARRSGRHFPLCWVIDIFLS